MSSPAGDCCLVSDNFRLQTSELKTPSRDDMCLANERSNLKSRCYNPLTRGCGGRMVGFRLPGAVARGFSRQSSNVPLNAHWAGLPYSYLREQSSVAQ